MTSERVVLLTVLTACMFGFSVYMQNGAWIFPFPLYEIGMLIAVISIYAVERQKLRLAGVLAILWCVAQLAASQFLIEFFMGSQKTAVFYSGSFSDFLHMGFCLLFLIWGIVICFQVHPDLLRWFAIACTILFILCFAVNQQYMAMAPLVVWLLILFFVKSEAAIHRRVLLVFTFFYLTKYASLLLFASP